jgi:hypothetical protein
MKVDNFALSMFSTCPAKYALRIREGWSAGRPSAALGFGGATHEGLAAWYRTHDIKQMLLAVDEAWPSAMPIDDWRTKEKCLRLMTEYCKEYPEESFRVVGFPENPLIECTFTLDTGLRLDDGEIIEYGGIFDGLVEFADSVYVLEHKTASKYDTYYFDRFKPDNQTSGYVWAAGEMSGRRVGGAIINGIFIYKASATKFERRITTRSPQDISAWLENVRRICQMIRDCERKGEWPMFTGSCTQWGLCEYHAVHVLSTATEQQRLLEQDYQRTTWDYEARTGVKAE